MIQTIDVATIEITDMFGAKQDILVAHLTRVQSPTPGERAMGWGAKLWMTGNPSCSVQCKETREQIRDLMGLVPVAEEDEPKTPDEYVLVLNDVVSRLLKEVPDETRGTDTSNLAVALYQAESLQRMTSRMYAEMKASGWTGPDSDGLRVDSVWRHEVRKTRYGLLGFATVQATDPVGEGDKLAVYLSLDGMAADGNTLWVRPQEEFLDGRFTKEGN